MNVAIFASAFYPSTGGVEELVRQMAHEYKRQGISTIVLTNRWPRTLPGFELYEEIPVYRLAMRIPDFDFKIRLNYWLNYPWVRGKMLSILKRHNIDLLHVHCVSSNGHYALVARKSLKLPLVLTTHGERTMDAGHVYETSPFQNQVLRKLMDEADHITACSRHTLQDLEEYRGDAFGERGSVVYNGIRPPEFASAVPYEHARPYILAIGRLVPQKGFDVLIEAFVQAGIMNYDLLIAGEGPEAEALANLVEKHGLKGRVHLLGRADRTLALSLFAGCSFFVLPSRQEPMGMVNIEAMAAGKAVIASCTGGVPEIVIDNETGLLVPPADVLAFSAAIRALASDADLRERLGGAGKKRAQKFTWAETANHYLRIYNIARGLAMRG